MGERATETPLSVALVEAPFGPAIWPSIGTSLLKAQLHREGHQASVLYANHFLLSLIGPDERDTIMVYQQISDEFGVHLGEWVFVDEAFPQQASLERDARYLELLARQGMSPALIAAARRVKERAGEFLDLAVSRFDWSRFDVVGFANTFSQLNAAIALARRLRALHPRLPFIVGGAGCSDEMGVGTIEACPLFKAAALGEADEIVVELCLAVRDEDDARLATSPGIAFRTADERVVCGPTKARVTQMDALPVPQYDDYYATLPSAYRAELPFYIPIEASRGCWWGAKHHCVFCGLNPDRMSHHAKRPERFLEEVRTLARLYAPARFMAVDNIMPTEFYEEVVPKLPAVSGGAEFFFEVKANFRDEQLRLFRQGGVMQIQPGVESLSSHVLGLMKKGITGCQNIATLRSCAELGIRAHWSILHGFHGETSDDYLAIAAIARRLFHLRPPLGVYQAEVERFAPLFRFAADHGLDNLRPSHWYAYCYPVPPAVLDKLAYRFDADRRPADPALPAAVFEVLAPVIGEWQRAHAQGTAALCLHQEAAGAPRGGAIVERHDGGRRCRYQLSPAALAVYRRFETPRKVTNGAPGGSAGLPSTPYLEPAFARACAAADRSEGEVSIDGAIDAAIYDQLLLHGLLVQESGSAVSVACDPQRHDAPAAPRRVQIPVVAVTP
jgi:ribosomal peptide maturation radical SAM protein 1